MKNPVAFLFGAGASYPFGLPMMREFYSRFRTHVATRSEPCMSLLEQFENHREGTSDLETLMTDLQTVMGVADASYLLATRDASIEEAIGQASELRGLLDAFIIDECERFDREKSAAVLRPLFDLQEHGQLWLFSTNYDRVIENACFEAGVDLSDGFSGDSRRSTGDWTGQFDAGIALAKLHGSVNWYEDDPGGALHRLDRGYSLPGHDYRLVKGKSALRPLMIIPTLEKQALAHPYVILATAFTDVLKDTSLLVVCGSSLRDRHVREYIEARLASLRVLVVSPTAEESRGLFRDPNHIHPLPIGFEEFMGAFGFVSDLVGKLAKQDGDTVQARDLEILVNSVMDQVRSEEALKQDPILARALSQLRSPSPATQLDAIQELSDSGRPAASKPLIAKLHDTDANPLVRMACVAPLVRLIGEEAIPALVAAIEADDVAEVRREAVLGLRKLGSAADARKALASLSMNDDEDPVIRAVIGSTEDGEHVSD